MWWAWPRSPEVVLGRLVVVVVLDNMVVVVVVVVWRSYLLQMSETVTY